MSKESRKKVLAESVLRSFLAEALKDGHLDSKEQANLLELCKPLKVNPDSLGPLIEEIRQSITANPQAGAANTGVFMRELAQRLSRDFDEAEARDILLKISKMLKAGEELRRIDLHSIYKSAESAGHDKKFRILESEGVNYVEVRLENDQVRTEAGAMRFYQGLISMESRAEGGVMGFFKAAMTNETFYKPVYTGTGLLTLEPSFANFSAIELHGEEIILDQGAYWASDIELKVSAWKNPAISAMFSGEGWYQTSVKGEGTVIVTSPGPLRIIDLVDDRLVVDGNFAVARSSSLNFRVARSTKSFWGSLSSGEGLVNTIEGSGRVWLAPIPNRNLMVPPFLRRGPSR